MKLIVTKAAYGVETGTYEREELRKDTIISLVSRGYAHWEHDKPAKPQAPATTKTPAKATDTPAD